MAKKYWDGEYDINTDWGGDESTSGLPLPGSAVQNVVKTKLNELDSSKVGYISDVALDGKVYFSTTKEAYDNGNYIGSVYSEPIYSLDLQEDENNKYIFLSSDSNKEFIWYFKTIEIATNKVYSENVTVEYIVKNKNGTDKSFSTVIESNSDKTISGFTKVVMNLDEYLMDGSSSLEIIVKGIRTKQERTLNRSFSIISLTIKDVTDFSKPFEKDLIVQTKINCTKGQNYFYEYRFDETGDFIFDSSEKVGNGSEETVNYDVKLSDIANGKHVFEYKIFVKIDTESEPYYTSTQRIEFVKGSETVFNEPQILIFSSYSDGENPLASDGNLLINGVSQYIPYDIRCSVYNSDVSSTNVEFYEIVDGVETAPVTTTIDNGNFFVYSIQSMEEGQKTIKVICKDLDGNIINGDGRIFYINVKSSSFGISEYKTNLRIDFSSIGKNNDSVDKESWVSNVDNGRFINNASFSETFDWSQGWTNNGLVLSEGCEIKFDYAPFPQQKDSPTTEEAMEYVGGDKAYTFEIEFMTQNVTNENAVVCNMMDETEGGKCGLLITGSEFKFTTPGGESVSTRFKSDEMNRLTIIVRPQTISTGAFKGLVELYINGVMSNIAKYTYNEKFEVFGANELGNLVSKNLCFQGVEGSDIVIKYIRAYNGSMSSDDVVNNYIIYRDVASEMLSLYNKNNVTNDQGVITPDSVMKLGNIPFLIFVGRTNADELASGDGNETSGETYSAGTIGANEENWYGTLEATTDKKKKVDMDVIYYNPLDKTKNFKFVKAYITPQGTSSMYYPKKNYRIYTQKNPDTRLFLSTGEAGVLELNQMLNSKFGENEEDRKYEFFRGNENKKKRVYSFKDNAQAVKCWCLKADFAETSSSHNTGVSRLWGETLKNSTVNLNNVEHPVFRTNAQTAIARNYNNNINGDMPDIRTTIDGFPIVVFGKKSYSDEYVFLGKYNFNNDKSTESVFGFCDIDNKVPIIDNSCDYANEVSGTVEHTLDEQLDQYMTCVETLDNGNALANFATMDTFNTNWADAFEFRYPEIPEKPSESDYKDSAGNWINEEGYKKDVKEFNEVILPYWENTHLKPFRHFAQWIYDTRWCDVNGNILNGLTEEEAAARKQKFAEEKWLHLDVWKMAAYYIYVMRFGAVDQVVKNSMLTSEGPFAFDIDGNKRGDWDSTDVTNELYGKYYKWYYINYDNDTVLGVKNDGHLAYGPEITRKDLEGSGSTASPIYAGYTSTLWNNFDYDEEFQEIIRIADQGISRTMTYAKTIEMFDVEQVGKWCERVYNKDAEYKYISPYMADWKYEDEDDEKAENFTDKLFMLQGSRTAHRRWWLSRRFNLFDGKWLSGDFASRYVEVKCDYGSIGDTFGAIAGANAFFGYQINNKTFGDAEGGVNQEYKAGKPIKWILKKNIQIGDPIAIFGSTDLLELNLQGLSNNLSSVLFYFGTNADLGNKLERLILSVPEEKLVTDYSYKTYSDDEVGTANRKTGFEKLKEDYPHILETDFEEGGKYPTSETPFDASSDSPEFYRSPVVDDEGNVIYVYFVKTSGGIRNYSCKGKGMTFDSLDKLQTLKMAGYMSVPSLDLTKNKFITDVDIRYSSISSVSFAEGARIKNFYASPSLTTLSFTRCDNVTLQNIMIDSQRLKDNEGINLTNITVENSIGLNHDGDFKEFIIKWMKGGYNHKPTINKSLILRNIHWTGATIDDIKTILTFINGDEFGKNKAKDCVITGIIEMGPEQLIKSDLEMFDELTETLGGSLIIKIPNPNIIIDGVKEEIVAGQTAEYAYTLFPSAAFIAENNGIVNFSFVIETTKEDNYDFYDSRNNKYYKEVSAESVRPGTSISFDSEKNMVYIKTTEKIIGQDISGLIMGKLTLGGETKFNMANILIKDPTYATNAIINGIASLNERNTEYTYQINLLTNDNVEPIGTVNVEWSINGNGISYISNSATSLSGRVLTLVTNEDEPELTEDITITATIKNHSSSSLDYPDFSVTKNVLVLNEKIILTNVSNPVVMAICYGQGWAESDIAMTREEGAAVTNIGNAFSNIKSETGWTFEEFQYFINENLTGLTASAFANSDITSIILPGNITTLEDGNKIYDEENRKYVYSGVFCNCKKLKTVVINENITKIPSYCFYNCEKLEKFVLPDSVAEIGAFSFGGTNIEEIAIKTNGYNSVNKAIYLTENSSLHTIKNDAFELEEWGTVIDTEAGKLITTNKLVNINIPKKLSLSDTSYNFLLSENLKNINIIDTVNSNLLLKDNVLYCNKYETIIARALPTVSEDDVVDTLDLSKTLNIFNYAFWGCKSIKYIKLGVNLYQYGLGVGAFFGSSLEGVDLSLCEILTEIKEFTFYNCQQLTEVLFPEEKSLYIIGHHAFYNSPYLTSINIPDTVSLFREDGTRGNRRSSYTIEECGITTFKVPENTLSLPYYFIRGCNNLTEITFSKYIQFSNSYSVMTNLNGLTKVNLPIFSETMDSNCYYVYRNGSVKNGPYTTEVEAQKAVTYYNDIETAIYGSSAHGVSFTIVEHTKGDSVIVNGDSFYAGQHNYFEDCPKMNQYIMHENDDRKLVFTDKDVAIYRISDTGNVLRRVAPSLAEYTIVSGTTEIIGAFAMCNNITSYTIPDSITILGHGSFAYCSNLTGITLSNSITEIGDYAFYNCSKLASIVIGNGVREIKNHAFFNNSSLQSVEVLSENLETIDTFAFCGCLNLSKMLFKKIDAPVLKTSETGTTIIDGILYKEYHPFGYRVDSFVGFNTKENGNVLYIPYNSNGYLTDEDWIKPLQTTEACGFKYEHITLNSIVTLNGSLLNNYQIVYLKSDSGKFVNDGNVESTTKGENGFIIQFNGKVYDNETIYVYSDSGCTTLIGSFVARYGVSEYILDAVMTTTKKNTLSFFSGLFGTNKTTTDTSTEMANITKLEYEILVSKINQLMKLLK